MTMTRALGSHAATCRVCTLSIRFPDVCTSKRSTMRNANLLHCCTSWPRRALRARKPCAASAAEAELALEKSSSGKRSEQLPANASIVAVVPAEKDSPLKAPWLEVMQHIAKRVSWVEPSFSMQVFTEESLSHPSGAEELMEAAQSADILLAVEVTSPAAVELLEQQAQAVPSFLCFDGAPGLQNAVRLGGTAFQPGPGYGLPEMLAALIPGSQVSKAAKTYAAVQGFWRQYSSDALLFAVMVVVDAYTTPVELVQSMRAQDLDSIRCMASNCGNQIMDCVRDPDCRAALQCLTACPPNDQVCSYRCIVSHESRLFEEFSLCVLQKNNCLRLNAQIPSLPEVQPMASFRGQPLTHETAEDIFIGWLGKNGCPWSWRVVAGQNPAYDQFSCQYQLYFRGKARGSMWYDPVFRVETLSGERVWRRRHYRVKRAQQPGSFHLSVLDNGVVSSEFWRIIDAPDDLSWALFFYQGAARVVGQSYTGSVLVSRDGAWPAKEHDDRLAAALEAACIKPWELFSVDNAGCEGAPLDLPPETPHPASIA